MPDRSSELEELRLEVATLRRLIDGILDQRPLDTVLVRACANVLYDRCSRVDQLEGFGGRAA